MNKSVVFGGCERLASLCKNIITPPTRFLISCIPSSEGTLVDWDRPRNTTEDRRPQVCMDDVWM